MITPVCLIGIYGLRALLPGPSLQPCSSFLTRIPASSLTLSRSGLHTRAQQHFSGKEQIKNILGFVGYNVCHNYSALFNSAIGGQKQP